MPNHEGSSLEKPHTALPTTSHTTEAPVDVRSLKRPDKALLVYYALASLILGPFFPFILIPMFFRYRTLRYKFDDEGVSMRWGILFRREIHLTYTRIQDIHLTSNILERWLGLGRVLVQTASGSSKAEMTIEGLKEFEAVRDFLYRRMRGMGEEADRAARGRGAMTAGGSGTVGMDGATAEELTTTLLAVAHELRQVRLALGRTPEATRSTSEASTADAAPPPVPPLRPASDGEA